MKVSVEGRELVIRIEMEDLPKPSASGKTMVVASSHGNVNTGVMVGDSEVIVGVNAYIKR
jgi:hypothetical protein